MKSLFSALLAPLLLLPSVAASQTSASVCGAPPAALKLAAPNIFSEQQEQWLGDAMADMLERRYRPVRDPAENAYLQRIGDRLLGVLPPTSIQFHFLLVDAPEINGFSLAGGRVYLTRKLVANARSEDEVAGVIAHEIGHILTHQFAIETTADLKRLMGVTSVTDRADVYAKFQRLVDLRSRDKSRSDRDSDDKQDQADRVAVYAVSTAGYRPQAYPELWDRSFFVGGKTGNAFGDFFGVTKPTEKRLRLMRDMAAQLPAGCGKGQSPDTRAFSQWHDLVLKNQRGADSEATPVSSQVKLEPALRMGLDHLRFSPDGKYLLAQDQSSIIVLTRTPFHQVFRFDAEDANEANFTPDSAAITFSTPSLHVEQWNISRKSLSDAREMNLAHACVDSTLSPDGRTLVCIRIEEAGIYGYSLDLTLIDVGSGVELLQHTSLFRPSFTALYTLALQLKLGLNSQLVPRSFSPDGNTLLIGPKDAKQAFDLRTRTAIKVSGKLNDAVDGAYAFLDSATVAGVSEEKSANSGLYSFPDGKQIKKMDLRFTGMEGGTADHHVIVHGVTGYVSAVADLEAGKLIGGNKIGPMAIWQSSVVGEGGDGSLLLMNVTDKGLTAAGQEILPISPLGRAQTVALSPDGNVLAFSTRTRGGLWDARTGKRVLLLKGFRGAWFEGKLFYAAFANDDPATSHVFRVDFATGKSESLPFELPKDAKFAMGRAFEWKTEGKKSTLTMHGREDNSVLWTHEFSGDVPPWTVNPVDEDLLVALPLNRPGVGDMVKGSVSLQAQSSAVRYKDSGYLMQVLSGTNGKVKDQFVIETPIVFDNMGGVDRVGGLLYVSLDDNRVAVYRVADGAQVRQLFGNLIAADAASGRICTLNRGDEITVYSSSGAELTHVRTGGTVRFAALRQGASELVVLTADQNVKRYSVPRESASAQ